MDAHGLVDTIFALFNASHMAVLSFLVGTVLLIDRSKRKQGQRRAKGTFYILFGIVWVLVHAGLVDEVLVQRALFRFFVGVLFIQEILYHLDVVLDVIEERRRAYHGK